MLHIAVRATGNTVAFLDYMDTIGLSYISGSHGFLGSRLQRSLTGEVTCLNHAILPTVTLKPFENFYFLSTYGNMYSHDNIEKVIQANLYDLIPIISQASQIPFKSFVFMSTSSVKLDYQTTYSRMKHAAEEILLTYMEKFNLPICIVRPLSITGVGEQKEHLIPSLIRSCMTGEHIDFVPGAVHDFIDVEDVVSAILNLSEASARGIFEVGWGKRYSNSEVLELVETITGKKANITKVESMRPYDNYAWQSTNFKARSWGWLPTKLLSQSIKEMVENYE